jgi:hypothetical protein
MPIVPQPCISTDLRQAIERSETMHCFIVANTPSSFVNNSDRILLVAGLYSLAREHHYAILYLLRAGQFDGSAFALARPLVEASYKAHWIHICAKPATIARIRNGGSCYPSLPDMADLIEKKMQTDGLFTYISSFITALHGYTHGGSEQLGRRFDENGDVRPNYDDDEKIELIELGTRVLVMLAIAYPQLVATASPGDDPNARAISERYVALYPGGRGGESKQ